MHTKAVTHQTQSRNNHFAESQCTSVEKYGESVQATQNIIKAITKH